MQKRLSDVDAQLELAKANVGDVVQLQSPLVQSAAKVLKRFLDKRYPLTTYSFSQRRKAVAQVRTGLKGPSFPLPAQGYLFDVLKNNGQHFFRDMQKSLVPRMIAAAGYRWHYFSLSRSFDSTAPTTHNRKRRCLCSLGRS
jgi:hypothetical protein